MWGMVLGIGGTLATSAALVPWRDDVARSAPALVFVLVVVGAALAGGRGAALVTAVGAALAFNLAFIPPYWTFEVDVLEDLIALAVFVVVAAVVGTLVAREAQQRRSAEQHAAEAARLSVLEQVDQQRAALLRSVSHDLRTPLSTIRAVTSDLRAGAAYDPATRNDLLELVVDEAERLDRIVANLLSMSRIEAGAFQPKRQAVALDELIGAGVARLDSVLRQRRVEVHVPDGLPLADADYSQLDQVVTNLLENAARHSPPGSTITVEAGPHNGMLTVAVQDEGPGVPAADRQRVFLPFWHAPGASTSGVGLSICQAIVGAHGGTIEVADSPHGARIVFTVPVRSDNGD
jgi:two-component system, OmpR family, sensor histidine kinase KdpD